MVNPFMLAYMRKLADPDAVLLPAAPGPMLGGKGPLDPGFVQDEAINGKLQDDLDDVIKTKLPSVVRDGRGKLKKDYAFAVVDLTDDPLVKAPAYAGLNDNIYTYIASLHKILPLYAAYQLRSDLRHLRDELLKSGPVDINKLAEKARLRYTSMDASTEALKLPNIETFFTIYNNKVDFAFDNKTDNDLDSAYGNPAMLATLKAMEHLRLMAGWSDNVAATLVIRALGFKYLYALAQRSGLYRTSWNQLTRHDAKGSGSGGLFCGRDYSESTSTNHPYWGDGPEERDWSFTPPKRPSQAGTARSVAYLMTMLAQEKLIDHKAHSGMYEMLRKGPPFYDLGDPRSPAASHAEYSPIGEGMSQASWTATQIEWDYNEASLGLPDFTAPLAVAKIGLDGIYRSNALLVRAQRSPAVNITAVLVAIAPGSNWGVIETFGEEMAQKLDKRHSVGP